MFFRMLRISGLSFKTDGTAVVSYGRTFNRGGLRTPFNPVDRHDDVVRPSSVSGLFGRTWWPFHLLTVNDAGVRRRRDFND
jgi:hypothetical protein